ncbi:phosphoribosyltransferase family protein [Pseudomonas sp. CCC3.1]|uniref:phosphoribosyltransferase family protein n=1 Tax=Pseudomonas sp. CCC3.1 TaxID=3048607 RepID=UPI002AC8F01F|nr:phosphoribosyltransferase family protein [Pseudomonas sp. CCC3.1]MEB0205341.1 phosphoribosyltransferase family protein [Pseudomonas sp. CCC3.1]WPX34698.1 phosphoribosyltransferase family protein [Pseudomonas sp. CCC3.1]
MKLLKDVYEKAKVVSVGSTLITVNEFSDQLPALRPEVLSEVANEVVKLMDSTADKIVTEEDKGAPLATAVSLLTGIPMAMARWYTYRLDSVNQAAVDITSEYFQGTLYLNGIQPGDRVVIVDDTLSTGGAVISLIESIRQCGGEVIDVICAVEKVQKEGAVNVFNKTGITVKTLMKIKLSGEKVEVLGFDELTS